MVKNLFLEYSNCNLCPRSCKVDRTKQLGICKESDKLSISAFLKHFGEEPPISFKNGSGTIFFTGCSLRCPFCQNMQISQKSKDKQMYNTKYYTTKEFIDIMVSLIENGAENINFVTPDHFAPHIIEGIKYLKKNNYNIPFIYNCSGYQSIANLESVIDYIDIFLFDYKFADSEASYYLLGLKNYPQVCEDALNYIYKNKGNLKLDKNGKALSGVLVRHLIMPNFIKNSIDVINNLFFEYGNSIYISIMSQYSPLFLRDGYQKIDRRLRREEYDEVISLVNKLNFKNGYIQDYIGYDNEFLPDFEKREVFNF